MLQESKLSPSSYRFRILTYDEKPTDDFGSRQVTLGPVLWEEPIGREVAWELKHRVCSAGDEAERIVNRDRCHVMVGYVLVDDETHAFHGDYVVRFAGGVPFWRREVDRISWWSGGRKWGHWVQTQVQAGETADDLVARIERQGRVARAGNHGADNPPTEQEWNRIEAILRAPVEGVR